MTNKKPNPFDRERNEVKISNNVIIGFLKMHPRPSDSIVHHYAMKHHYEVDDFEEAIYRIAGIYAKEKK